MLGLGLLVTLLLVGTAFAALFHFALVPFSGNDFVHCLMSGLIFGAISYLIALLFFRKYYEIKAEKKTLERDLKIDNLTRLLNRGAFDLDTENLQPDALFAAIFIDIDNFHDFNNRYGHAVGDFILKKVAQTIQSCVRQQDRVYRYGGEEVVVLLNGCNRDDGRRIAEKIRSEISLLNNTPYPQITVSLGVAAYPEDGTVVPRVLRAADQAMLIAKTRGKNRTELCC